MIGRRMTATTAREASVRSGYVHGYDEAEELRLNDQATTLEALLHHDTAYPPGSTVLEAGCGVGAQTVGRSTSARWPGWRRSGPG